MTYCKRHPETKYLGLREGDECPICWSEKDSTHKPAQSWWSRLAAAVVSYFDLRPK